MKRFWIGVLITALLTACTDKQPPVPEEDAQVATHVSIFSSKENQKQWVLQAQSVNFENMQSATLKDPRLVLKQDGKDSATVSGNLGKFAYAQQLVTIDGNAIVDSLTERVRITAPRFFYNVETDRIWSDAKTVITRGSARSVALNGIETNSKLTKIIIKKHATQLPANMQELKGTTL